MNRKRIVVIGGGFGGVYAARALERRFSESDAEICLINRENYFVFQPLLPEVISGSVGVLDTVSPIRRLCKRTRLFVRDIEAIDLAGRTVSLSPGFRPRRTELGYDHLVIAAGTVPDFSGVPGLAEHALPFRSLGDALRLRNRAIQVLEEAANEPDPEFRRHLLTFVVAGGGLSGVECVAELNDFLRRATRIYRTISPDDIRCVLIHSGQSILAELAPALARYAQDLLQRRGVILKLGCRVQAATPDSVILTSGETIAARTLVSTVPAGPSPLIRSLPAPKEHGRLLVNEHLELGGFEGVVWAAGDCAAIRMPDGSLAPATAQHATREAELVAGNIKAAADGRPQTRFLFAGLGKLASLGHHSAVVEVLGLRLSGLFAWFLWRGFCLMRMPGLDRKIRVAFDWFFGLILPGDIVQLKIQPTDNIVTEHFESGETVFDEGDVGDRLYVIEQGSVEILRGGAVIATLGRGEYFGEMALLSDAPRNATVRALEATDLLAVAKADLAKLREGFPDLATKLSDLAEQRRLSI